MSPRLRRPLASPRALALLVAVAGSVAKPKGRIDYSPPVQAMGLDFKGFLAHGYRLRHLRDLRPAAGSIFIEGSPTRSR